MDPSIHATGTPPPDQYLHPRIRHTLQLKVQIPRPLRPVTPKPEVELRQKVREQDLDLVGREEASRAGMLPVAPAQVGSIRGDELRFLLRRGRARARLWHESEAGEGAGKELRVLGYGVGGHADEGTAWDDGAVMEFEIMVDQAAECHCVSYQQSHVTFSS